MADYLAELAELMPEGSTVPRQGIGINVKRLLKLRGRLMLLLFLLLAVPSITVIWMLVPRQFVAHATLEFKAGTPSIITDQGRPMTGPTYENYVNTQIELIQGPTILRRVLENEEVSRLPAIARRSDPLHYLIRNISAESQRRTELVQLTYKDVNRQTAETVLNTVLEEYMQYTYQQEVNRGGIVRDTLAGKEKELRKQLDEQREQIAGLRRQLEVPVGDVPGEPTETESFRINLAQAEADLSTAQNQKRQVDGLLARLREFISQYERNPQDPIYAIGVEEKVAAHPEVIMLKEQLTQVEQEYAVLQETYVEGAPQLKVKGAEFEVVNEKVEAAETKARREALQALLAQYEYERSLQEANIEDAKERRDRFLALLEENRQHNLEISQGLAEIEEMERRYNDTREYLRLLENQLLTIEIESNAPARASVLSEATVARNPDHSRRLKFILVALFIAVSVSVGAGLLLEASDQSIRSAQDVAYVTDKTVLSSILHTSEDRLPASIRPELVAEEYPGSMTADEFRRTAARVLTSPSHGGEVHTCLVTSPTRGDGKTTLACNLAIVLAQAGRRVLLVDMDSRNPSVEHAFGLKPAVGLAELLLGKTLTEDPDRATEYENLFVLGPGLRGSELIERMASKEIRDFLQTATGLFDHIIIDTPASLLMAETKFLAGVVDGVVIVAGAGVSSFGMLRRCLNSVEDAGARIMGIVVNGVRYSPGGYLRRNLDQYYLERSTRQGAEQRPARNAGTSPALQPSGPDTGDETQPGENG